jgi:hypothetical protein
MGYKRKVSYSHYSYIQSYSIFNRINASGFSVPQVLIVGVLMFVQQTHVFLFSRGLRTVNIVRLVTHTLFPNTLLNDMLACPFIHKWKYCHLPVPVSHALSKPSFDVSNKCRHRKLPATCRSTHTMTKLVPSAESRIATC